MWRLVFPEPTLTNVHVNEAFAKQSTNNEEKKEIASGSLTYANSLFKPRE